MAVEVLPPDAFVGRQLRREGPWIVAFLADWCPFCRAFRASFGPVDGGTAFRTGIADVTEYDSPLWDDFGIEVVPALAVFSEGQLVHLEQSDPGAGLPAGSIDRARAIAATSRR